MKILALKKKNRMKSALLVALCFSITSTPAQTIHNPVKQNIMLQGKAVLPPGDLPNGIYCISACTDNTVFRKKIVVAH